MSGFGNSGFGSSPASLSGGRDTNFGSTSSPSFFSPQQAQQQQQQQQQQRFGTSPSSVFGSNNTATPSFPFGGSSISNQTNATFPMQSFGSSPPNRNDLTRFVSSSFTSPGMGGTGTNLAFGSSPNLSFGGNSVGRGGCTPFGSEVSATSPVIFGSGNAESSGNRTASSPYGVRSAFGGATMASPAMNTFDMHSNHNAVMDAEEHEGGGGNGEEDDTNMDNDEVGVYHNSAFAPQSSNKVEMEEEVDDTRAPFSSASQEAKAEQELAVLRARIEEKKKRLVERKRVAANSTPSATKRDHENGVEEDFVEDILPPDMSRSLVGTCLTMCPEEEWKQREIENDISLLEIPWDKYQPSLTIADTTIKRFRRSAADYKLDVPELVRPPPVLERTLAYMEEWSMERDRQDPDAFPPLDVYRFIWDRTRMIRKDFILQNYIGGADNHCSAVAVRVHERIARWHAMMEHQLSHIPDFTKVHSQQNIMELGQTMKTLNFYYDDVLGRSIVDDDNDQKGEGKDFYHGCQFTNVQGPRPTHEDGTTPLDNTTAVPPQRIIGNPSSSSTAYSKSTAEPEMRALYILLTMDNDGGMEVLKYAARLSITKPRVYKSPPVQLALTIYKVKKEYNYAKFFSIMRSKSTPYLFACIMFKHVELMRKIALRVMAKTFGARQKETGVNMYDAYPIKDLVRLLCFEDVQEARDTCAHYNIDVDYDTDMIYWRKSDFKERRDPTKDDVIVSCPPKKMCRVLESKVGHLTRLAVCRGDVSGVGAVLTPPQPTDKPTEQSNATTERTTKQPDKQRNDEQDTNEEIQRREKLEKAKKMAEAVASAIAQRKKQLELAEQLKKKQEEERKRKLLREEQLRAKAKQEEERKRQEEERKRLEEEDRQRRLLEQQREEERRQRLLQEAQEKAARELRQQQEEQRLRQQQEEQARIKKLQREEEQKRILEQQRLHQLQMEQKRKERERQLLLEQKKRQEEERKRQIAAREQMRERIEKEWRRKLKHSHAIFVLRKWRRLVRERYHTVHRTRLTLASIDPTRTDSIGGTDTVSPPAIEKITGYSKIATATQSEPTQTLTRIFQRLKTTASDPIHLAHILKTMILRRYPSTPKSQPRRKIVTLFKMAVILPENNPHPELSKAIASWLRSKFRFGSVFCETSRLGDTLLDSRVVVVEGNADVRGSDVVLFLIPPLLDGTWNFSEECLNDIPDDAQRMVLHLREPENNAEVSDITRLLDSALGETVPSVNGTAFDPLAREGVLTVDIRPEYPNRIDEHLQTCCSALVHSFVEKYFDSKDIERSSLLRIERISLAFLARRCMRRVLERTKNDLDKCLYVLLENVLRWLVDEIGNVASDIFDGAYATWPAHEFADGGTAREPSILRYFQGNDKDELPLNWHETLLARPNIEKSLWDIFPFEKSSTLYTVGSEMLKSASHLQKHKCDLLYRKKEYRLFWEQVLAWQETSEKSTEVLFLPRGMSQEILTRSDKYMFCDDRFAANERNDGPRDTATIEDEYFQHAVASVDKRQAKQNYPRENPSDPQQLDGVRLTPVADGFAQTKRKKDDPKEGTPGSKKIKTFDVEESRKFTNHLEALLAGRATVDIQVGKDNLADVLASRASPIIIPD